MLMRMLLLGVVDRYGGLDGAGGDRKDLGVRLYYIDGVGFVCYLDACTRKSTCVGVCCTSAVYPHTFQVNFRGKLRIGIFSGT